MLVLNPNIIDSSGMEPLSMEMAYAACLHTIRLHLMNMSQNHSTSGTYEYYCTEMLSVKLTVMHECHIALQVPC